MEQADKKLINKTLLKSKYYRGFTLAEIMVTIAIVSVIAGLTIPSLVQYIENQQFKTAYVKATADASAAWLSASNDGLMQSVTVGAASPGSPSNFDQFQSKFDVVKTCTFATKSQCWATSSEDPGAWYGSPYGYTTGGFFIDKQGRAWGAQSDTSYFMVDTNGFAGPNIYGKDRFVLYALVHNAIYTGDTGVPTIISPIWGDYTTVDAGHCPTPPCYYKSWILGAH